MIHQHNIAFLAQRGDGAGIVFDKGLRHIAEVLLGIDVVKHACTLMRRKVAPVHITRVFRDLFVVAERIVADHSIRHAGRRVRFLAIVSITDAHRAPEVAWRPIACEARKKRPAARA